MKHLIALVSTFVLVAGFGFAQDDIFSTWDADADGTVTSEEFGAGVFSTFDENDDGVLDEQEYEEYEAWDDAEETDFEDYDTDASGDISEDEWNTTYDASASIYQNFDADANDMVTTDEYRAGVFSTYDENDDGVLDEQEYEEYEAWDDAEETDFDDYDTDASGDISEDEWNEGFGL